MKLRLSIRRNLVPTSHSLGAYLTIFHDPMVIGHAINAELSLIFWEVVLWWVVVPGKQLTDPYRSGVDPIVTLGDFPLDAEEDPHSLEEAIHMARDGWEEEFAEALPELDDSAEDEWVSELARQRELYE